VNQLDERGKAAGADLLARALDRPLPVLAARPRRRMPAYAVAAAVVAVAATAGVVAAVERGPGDRTQIASFDGYRYAPGDGIVSMKIPAGWSEQGPTSSGFPNSASAGDMGRDGYVLVITGVAAGYAPSPAQFGVSRVNFLSTRGAIFSASEAVTVDGRDAWRLRYTLPRAGVLTHVTEIDVPTSHDDRQPRYTVVGLGEYEPIEHAELMDRIASTIRVD
jgi:hypothetical protein